MARVAQMPGRTGTDLPPSGHDQRLATKSSKHKIVLESVTQEKKKLRSVLSFKAEPPRGYTYIPAGNPELTNALKDFARKGNYEIYAVSTTPHQRAHDLSQQVHRIGFHFPSVVVAQVCAHYGIVLTSAGTLLAEDDFPSFHRRSKRLKEQAASQERKDQVTINTEARDTIRDLFPNIPDNDLNQIIKTAFQKGQGKVGTANELSLIRRAQLAVVAHIRHIYTEYDRLLRQTHYRDARNLVEKPTLRRLVQWRGDDESGKQVLEDVFREVVVISDDEDGSEEDGDMDDFRDVSVEIVSSNTKADHLDPDPLVLEEPPVDRRLGEFTSTRGNRLPQNEPVSSCVRKEQRNDKDKVNRRGFSRYQAWNEAREEYRANLTRASAVEEQAQPYSASETSFRRPKVGLSGVGYRTRSPTPENLDPYRHQDIPAQRQPHTFRTEDGTLYERLVNYPLTDSQESLARPVAYETRNPAVIEQVRPIDVTKNTYLQSRRHGFDSRRDAVLPSIEGPQLPTPSKQSVNRYSLPSITERRAGMTRHGAERRVDDIEFLDLTEDTTHPNKRPKRDYSGSDISGMPVTATAVHNRPSQQRKQEYSSLLSPGHQSSDRRKSNALLLSHYERPQDHGKALPFIQVPSYHESQAVPSPMSVDRGSHRRVTHLADAQPSSMGQFHLREGLSPSTYSPRMKGQSILSRRFQPTSPGGASPVDRGVQEYRAFRAREQQHRALNSPIERGQLRLREVSDCNYAAIESERGGLGQIDGVEPLRDPSHHLPSQGRTQGLIAVSDSISHPARDVYALTPGRTSERNARRRRRSASPVQNPVSLRSYTQGMPRAYHREQPTEFTEHVPLERNYLPQRDGLEAVIGGPTQRHERGRYNAGRFLPLDYEVEEPRSASLYRSYTQL